METLETKMNTMEAKVNECEKSSTIISGEFEKKNKDQLKSANEDVKRLNSK